LGKLKNKVIAKINNILIEMEEGKSTKLHIAENIRLSGYFVYPWLFRIDIISTNRKPLTLEGGKK